MADFKVHVIWIKQLGPHFDIQERVYIYIFMYIILTLVSFLTVSVKKCLNPSCIHGMATFSIRYVHVYIRQIISHSTTMQPCSVSWMCVVPHCFVITLAPCACSCAHGSMAANVSIFYVQVHLEVHWDIGFVCCFHHSDHSKKSNKDHGPCWRAVYL